MKGIPVKYNGVVVGWTDAEAKSIKFEDNEEAKKIKEEIMRRESIGLSSRAIGEVDEKGNISKSEMFESSIIKIKYLEDE